MKSIIISQDELMFHFKITNEKWIHIGLEDVYAIAIYYTGHIIYNLDYNPEKYEKKIIITD